MLSWLLFLCRGLPQYCSVSTTGRYPFQTRHKVPVRIYSCCGDIFLLGGDILFLVMQNNDYQHLPTLEPASSALGFLHLGKVANLLRFLVHGVVETDLPPRNTQDTPGARRIILGGPAELKKQGAFTHTVSTCFFLRWFPCHPKSQVKISCVYNVFSPKCVWTFVW